MPASTAAESTTFPVVDDHVGLMIGERRVQGRYFLAPLAGYTNLAFRRAIRGLGGLGLATTDLVQSTTLLSRRPRALELIATHPDDNPLSVQIHGGHADELTRAARWLEDHGYGGVDINMGCPMGKVTGGGGGARLMCDRDNAIRLVSDVVDAVSIPVTVKMRLGWDRDSITAPLLAADFERAGVAAITVHGRTRQQGFGGVVDQSGIRDVVQAVDSIPIIGNGDIRSPRHAFQMRHKTGCAAVAIGRGAMLDPWIFCRIQDALAGRGLREPTSDEQIAFLDTHFRLMTEQHDEYACVLFRKFAAWYGARLGIPEDLEDGLRRFSSYREFDQIVADIGRRHGERESTVPTALIRVPNGPVERW